MFGYRNGEIRYTTFYSPDCRKSWFNANLACHPCLRTVSTCSCTCNPWKSFFPSDGYRSNILRCLKRFNHSLSARQLLISAESPAQVPSLYESKTKESNMPVEIYHRNGTSKANMDFAPSPHLVADLSLASEGHLKIGLAEVEMPGLMACRDKMQKLKPLDGVKITGSVHMTVETAVLIDTLQELGAILRWCSSNAISTQDYAAAAIAEKGTAAIFAWRGQTTEEYWQCILRALSWPDEDGPDLIIDNGGDLTRFIHEGFYAEKQYRLDGNLPDSGVDDPDLRVMHELLSHEIPKNPKKWSSMVAQLVGVSEETGSGVHRAENMQRQDKLLFPIIDVNRSITKSAFENLYGCRHSVLDALRRATDIMVAGKSVMVCGYGEVGKGCAQAFKTAGARCFVSETNPIRALLAAMEGFEVKTLDEVVGFVDIVITATGGQGIVQAKHLKRMKNNAIVGNMGHFETEINVPALAKMEGCKKISIKDNVDRYCFPDGHGLIVLASGRVMNLSCATGNPSFVMSGAFTNQTLAQIELWQNRNTAKYSKKVYALPREMDEKVAELHLKHLNATLTVPHKD